MFCDQGGNVSAQEEKDKPIALNEIEQIIDYIGPKGVEGTSKYDCYKILSEKLHIPLLNVIKFVLVLHEMGIASYSWSTLPNFIITLSKNKLKKTPQKEIVERSRKYSSEANTQLENTLKSTITPSLATSESNAKQPTEKLFKKQIYPKRTKSKHRSSINPKLETKKAMAQMRNQFRGRQKGRAYKSY
jgi:hypothetical protein